MCVCVCVSVCVCVCVWQKPPECASIQCSKKWGTKDEMTSQEERQRGLTVQNGGLALGSEWVEPVDKQVVCEVSLKK